MSDEGLKLNKHKEMTDELINKVENELSELLLQYIAYLYLVGQVKKEEFHKYYDFSLTIVALLLTQHRILLQTKETPHAAQD